MFELRQLECSAFRARQPIEEQLVDTEIARAQAVRGEGAATECAAVAGVQETTTRSASIRPKIVWISSTDVISAGDWGVDVLGADAEADEAAGDAAEARESSE